MSKLDAGLQIMSCVVVRRATGQVWASDTNWRWGADGWVASCDASTPHALTSMQSAFDRRTHRQQQEAEVLQRLPRLVHVVRHGGERPVHILERCSEQQYPPLSQQQAGLHRQVSSYTVRAQQENCSDVSNASFGEHQAALQP